MFNLNLARIKCNEFNGELFERRLLIDPDTYNKKKD